MKGSFAILALLLLAMQSLCLSISNHDLPFAEFCWRDSYGRGVGTFPTTCGSFDQIGGLCYVPCPNGYTRNGVDCQQNCPVDSGWADQGLYCRLVEYRRGGGYAWQGADGFSSNGMFSRCEQDNGLRNCEQSGSIVYPKCKASFNLIGCCICRPAVPDCNALGFNGGVDLSCVKKIIAGVPATWVAQADLITTLVFAILPAGTVSMELVHYAGVTLLMAGFPAEWEQPPQKRFVTTLSLTKAPLLETWLLILQLSVQ